MEPYPQAMPMFAYVTGDVGQATTATGVALSLLREAFGRPPQ